MLGDLVSHFRAFVEFKAINELTKPLREIQALSEKTKSSLEKLSEASAKLASSGAKLAGFFGFLSAPMGLALKEAVEFEKVFLGEFNKVVGATGKELEEFKSYFMELSEQIPLTATEIAQLSAGLAQMGIPTEQLKEFTKLVSQASFAFDITAEEAGRAFGEIRNAFGIKTVSELREVGDAINYLSNTMGASASDIVEILKRVGASAHDLGLKAKAVAVFGATIREAGYQPELVSSALNILFMRLSTFDDKLLKVLQTVGMTKGEFKALMEASPEKAILKLLFALKGLDSEARSRAIKELVGSEHFSKIKVLVNNLDKLKMKLTEIGEGKHLGSMESEVNSLLQTTSAQLELLRNRIQNIAISIGAVLLPPFNLFLSVVSFILSPISKLVSEHQTLAKVLLLPVVGVVGLIALLGILASAFGLLGIAITKGISSLVELKGTLSELKNTASEVIPALKNLYLQVMANAKAFWMWLHAGEVQAGWIGTLDYRLLKLKLRLYEFTSLIRAKGLKGVLSSGISELTGFLSLLGGRVSNLKVKLSVLRLSFISLTRASLAFIATPLGATLSAIGIAVYLLYTNFDRLKKALSALYETLVVSRILPFFEGIKIGLIHTKEGIDALKSAFSPLLSALSELKKAIGELLSPFRTLFVEVAKVFGFDTSAFKSSLEQGITLGKALAFVFNTTAKVIAFALKPVVWSLTLIVKVITKIIELLKKLAGLVKEAFNVLKKPVELGKNLIGGLVSGVKAGTSLALNAVKEAGSKIVEGFKSLFGIKSPSRLFMNFGKNLLEGLVLGMKKLREKPLETLNSIAKDLTLKPSEVPVKLGSVIAPALNLPVPTVNQPSGTFATRQVVNFSLPKTQTSKSLIVNKIVDKLEVKIDGSVNGEPKEIAKEIAGELQDVLLSLLKRF